MWAINIEVDLEPLRGTQTTRPAGGCAAASSSTLVGPAGVTRNGRVQVCEIYTSKSLSLNKHKHLA